MALEYVKHEREVSPKDLQDYGRLATHDIKAPILLGYELGHIKDKNGTQIKFDRAYIQKTVDETNKFIEGKNKSPFAKMKSFWSKDISKVQAIPLIKNHDAANVDSVSGYTEGLLYTEETDGILAFYAKGVIQSLEDKKKVENGLLKATSFGTRAGSMHSIKEISFVVNEAIPHAGLVLSEQENETQGTAAPELQFAEEIASLEFSEARLNNTIIPNHIVLSKLIRSGRLEPFKYDSLIESDTAVLELMEQCTPQYNLGLMLGTARHPEKSGSVEDMVANKILADIANKRKKEKGHKKSETLEQDNKKPAPKKGIQFSEHEAEKDTLIHQSLNFEEERTKELKRILELSEFSVDAAKKYLKTELGDQSQQANFRDEYLEEYMSDSRKMRDKINQLKKGVQL